MARLHKRLSKCVSTIELQRVPNLSVLLLCNQMMAVADAQTLPIVGEPRREVLLSLFLYMSVLSYIRGLRGPPSVLCSKHLCNKVCLCPSTWVHHQPLLTSDLLYPAT